MDIEIKDGTGRGYEAKVTSENRLLTQSLSISPQQHEALIHAQAYQVEGSLALSATTLKVLYIENTSTTLDMVITYIRAQIASASGGSYGSATYFLLGKGETYTSGGTAVTPSNTNAGSSNAADVVAYTGPTLGGTFVGMDTWYPTVTGDKNTWRKEGSVIIPPGKSFSAQFVTDHTGGLAYVRVSFLMTGQEES